MKQLFYPDGDEVKIGDIIWVNEGMNVRQVTEVVTDKRFARKQGLDDVGLSWTRYVGTAVYESNEEVGIGGYEEYKHFVSEGIGKLSHVELSFLRLLSKIFHQQYGIDVMSPDVYYYPIYYGEKVSSDEYFFCWYFIICQDAQPSYAKERCYRFNEDSQKFEEMSSAIKAAVRTF